MTINRIECPRQNPDIQSCVPCVVYQRAQDMAEKNPRKADEYRESLAELCPEDTMMERIKVPMQQREMVAIARP